MTTNNGSNIMTAKMTVKDLIYIVLILLSGFGGYFTTLNRVNQNETRSIRNEREVNNMREDEILLEQQVIRLDSKLTNINEKVNEIKDILSNRDN